MPEVLTALAELQKSGGSGALCTIVKTKGSTPRKEGCKMLVYQDGTIKGTIGGGEVEGRVIKEALEAIQSGEPTLCSYDLINPDQGDPDVFPFRLESRVFPFEGQPGQKSPTGFTGFVQSGFAPVSVISHRRSADQGHRPPAGAQSRNDVFGGGQPGTPDAMFFSAGPESIGNR